MRTWVTHGPQTPAPGHGERRVLGKEWRSRAAHVGDGGTEVEEEGGWDRSSPSSTAPGTMSSPQVPLSFPQCGQITGPQTHTIPRATVPGIATSGPSLPQASWGLQTLPTRPWPGSPQCRKGHCALGTTGLVRGSGTRGGRWGQQWAPLGCSWDFSRTIGPDKFPSSAQELRGGPGSVPAGPRLTPLITTV